MKLLRQVLPLCAFIGVALGVPFTASAADAAKDLVLKGDAACTACHDEADGPELLAIGKTRHGTVADSRTPTCTACHGPSKAHLDHKDNSKKRPGVDRSFKAKLAAGAEPGAEADHRSAGCQECHKKDANRSHWEGSAHQSRDVTCASCHKIHVAKDVVRDKFTQSESCYSCHKEQRAQHNKPSHHPVAEGKMACSDCHNVHGSVGPKLVKRASTNETCFTCHMEKRGPFVHSHQPVAEDCSTCHNPHGTVAESMLKVRPPFLCNSCHTTPHSPVQPALGAIGAKPGWWTGSVNTQGRSCLSCHTQIHGSNNPSSANPTPQRFFR